jgi:heme/copper-type cytochrome/quinol oxidase subunit 3
VSIDAPALPDHGFSHHPPIWWGSRLVIAIEGAAFAILVVTYFYVWRNSDTWPPTGTLVPDLGVSMFNLVVLVVGILPMWHVARLAARHDSPRVLGVWLFVCVAFGIAAAILRLMEFKGVHTRWSNAYGAIVWSILAVHFAHILAATLETLVIGILVIKGPVEEKHFVDTPLHHPLARIIAAGSVSGSITVNAVYWYFVALSWVGLWAIVYLAPRVM